MVSWRPIDVHGVVPGTFGKKYLEVLRWTIPSGEAWRTYAQQDTIMNTSMVLCRLHNGVHADFGAVCSQKPTLRRRSTIQCALPGCAPFHLSRNRPPQRTQCRGVCILGNNHYPESSKRAAQYLLFKAEMRIPARILKAVTSRPCNSRRAMLCREIFLMKSISQKYRKVLMGKTLNFDSTFTNPDDAQHWLPYEKARELTKDKAVWTMPDRRYWALGMTLPCHLTWEHVLGLY